MAYGAFNLDEKETDPLRRKRFLPSGLVETGGKLAAVNADLITEEVAHSRYSDSCAGHPSQGKTEPLPDKEGAYTWLKAPRYGGAPAEVGPLARAVVGYAAGDARLTPALDQALKAAGVGAAKLQSVLGRHLARVVESRLLAAAMADWLGELRPGEPAALPLEIPAEARGAGLTDGPRGALGHWIEIKDKVISRYQLVVPTTWNGSPRDQAGTPGPIEQALIGTKVKDRDNPFEVVRIIRSFDPCLACSVHVLTAAGEGRGVYRIV
jgi:hydrogenase large subunit